MTLKRTKIVCTIGPACDTEETLVAMVKAGMNVARLNFSHGTHADHERLITLLRLVEKITQEPIAIMQDLQGPKIRIGLLPAEGVQLKSGETTLFDTSAKVFKKSIIPIDYPELHRFVKKNDRLFIADGKIELKIISVDGTRIEAIVVVPGTVLSHKGINVPDTKLAVRAMTEKDKDDLRFGIGHDVDMIALSFVQSAKDIDDARALIRDQTLMIVAKIERGEALKHMEEILSAADGI